MSPSELSIEYAEKVAERMGVDLFPFLLRPCAGDLVDVCWMLSREDPVAAAAFFASEFSGVELLHQVDASIRELFDKGLLKAELTRTCGFWSRLPEAVTAYRGLDFQWGGDPRGISWTLSRARADWFADRWGVGEGRVVTADIPRDLIVLANNDRRESTLVVPWWDEINSVEIPARPRRDLRMLHR